MTLLAWPDMAAERNLYAIEVPHVASLYLTHSWDGEVKGLKAAPREDRPYVPIVFFAFRIMVAMGNVRINRAEFPDAGIDFSRPNPPVVEFDIFGERQFGSRKHADRHSGFTL
jgi:hypothetical protein